MSRFNSFGQIVVQYFRNLSLLCALCSVHRCLFVVWKYFRRSLHRPGPFYGICSARLRLVTINASAYTHVVFIYGTKHMAWHGMLCTTWIFVILHNIGRLHATRLKDNNEISSFGSIRSWLIAADKCQYVLQRVNYLLIPFITRSLSATSGRRNTLAL